MYVMFVELIYHLFWYFVILRAVDIYQYHTAVSNFQMTELCSNNKQVPR